ncbi:uncharacterized protein LOC124899505 [Capsicum annuum]|uniref:uncharacterized protein LOC124899505 n=1 Tax=Capsicum annuum TaxID=4072 RepID=UPI001FB112E2|nr:uncharacterized protein LOC124899505 [Capsicum annuum]
MVTRSGKILSGLSVGKSVSIEKVAEEPVEQHPEETEKKKSFIDISDKEKEEEVVLKPIPTPPPPFPQRLRKKADDAKFNKFLAILKQLTLNVPLIEALEQMPNFAKFMKEFLTKKWKFTKALCDIGVSINLMSLDIYKKLGLGEPIPTTMHLVMVERPMKRLVGILHDVSVKVDNLIVPADFVILDCDVYFKEPIILGRPLLATGRVLVYMDLNELKFRFLRCTKLSMAPKRKNPTTSKKANKESVPQKLVNEDSDYEDEEPLLRWKRKRTSPKTSPPPKPIKVEDTDDTEVTTSSDQAPKE